MSTAQQIINDSAKLAGILAQGQALEAGINTDSLKTLNRMIARWRNDAVDIGLPVFIASDTVIIDDADEEAIYLGLALRFMVTYKRPIPPGLSQSFQDSYVELQAKYQTIPIMQLDAALTRKYLPHKELGGST